MLVSVAVYMYWKTCHNVIFISQHYHVSAGHLCGLVERHRTS